MARIDWVDDDEATGEVADIYEAWKKANPERDRMPGILKCFSLRPDLLRHLMEASYGLHFREGFLTCRIKEMIATLVSALNQCEH